MGIDLATMMLPSDMINPQAEVQDSGSPNMIRARTLVQDVAVNSGGAEVSPVDKWRAAHNLCVYAFEIAIVFRR